MAVNATSSTSDVYVASAPASSAASDATMTSDRFLKLLVAQMKNQDPLNPMDNAQVTSQMAQINTVTGIDKLNTTVAGLSAQFMQMQAMQGASLVGHDVIVAGNKLDIDPVTMAQLEKYGLKPDSKVYRVMEEKYLDTANRRVAGNPNSVAAVRDPYDLVDNPLVKMIEDAGETVPPEIPRKVPKTKGASQLDRPGLNVAVDDPSGYATKDTVKIAIRVEDIVRNGGKIYADDGAMIQGIKPIYVTFDGSVPYTRVP